MGVAKQGAEQVAGPGVAVPPGVGMCVRMRAGVLGATVVVARLVLDLWVRGRGGAVSGAVPLAHEVRDAQHGRVEDQVPSAGLGRPLGAGRVGPQSLAELSVEAIHGRRQVCGERDKVAGALLDAALRSGHLTLTWGRERDSKVEKKKTTKTVTKEMTQELDSGHRDLMKRLIVRRGCDRTRKVSVVCSKEVTEVCRRL